MICRILLLLLFVNISFGQSSFHLFGDSNSSNRISLVLVAEGFTKTEEEKFKVNSTNILKKVLSTSPYSEYTNVISAKGIYVESVESGADHPSTGIVKDTYFDATFDTSGIARLLTLKKQHLIYPILNKFAPDYDIVLVIVNDSQYGGAGGSIATTSINSSSPNVAIHEFGHSFAGLGDEYTTPYPGYPAIEEPNTTTNINRNTLKWSVWVNPSTPIPTPSSGYTTNIGLFEGAHYNSKGWYRPKHDCGMRTLGKVFCEICQEQIIKSIYSRLKIIEGRFPVTNRVILSGDFSFAVSDVVPSKFVTYYWYFNDNFVGTNSTLTLFQQQVTLGTNRLEIVVNDKNPRLKLNIEDRFSWLIINNQSNSLVFPRIDLRIKRK